MTQTRQGDHVYRFAMDWRTASFAHVFEFQNLTASPRRSEKARSQPFFVAEQFTGKVGVYSPVKGDTEPPDGGGLQK